MHRFDHAGGKSHTLSMTSSEVESLGERIRALHDEICRLEPAIDRLACALYDPGMDLLKTFVNSTRKGVALTAYQYRLSDSPSLRQIASSGEPRIIADIPAELDRDSAHTRWLLAQGYRSSYTMPLFVHGELEGFLFFDSMQPGAFSPALSKQLSVYGRLVALMIGIEATAVRSLVRSVRIAREFAMLRDVETGEHLERMSRYSWLIARAVAASHDRDDEFVEMMFLFSPLHDIGKIGVPDAILRKEGLLTADEREQMRLHVAKGSEIVERLVRDFTLESLLGIGMLRNMVAAHHELLDGSGYPAGLRGEQIPLEARIATVADIFDALTSRRIYKQAWSLDETFNRLGRMVAEGKIDASCVQALHDQREELLQIMDRFPTMTS